MDHVCTKSSFFVVHQPLRPTAEGIMHSLQRVSVLKLEQHVVLETWSNRNRCSCSQRYKTRLHRFRGREKASVFGM